MTANYENMPNDPDFRFFEHQVRDSRFEKEIAALMNSHEVRSLNDAVLDKILKSLTYKGLTKDKKNELELLISGKKLYSMVVFRDNPWLLPYYLAAFQKPRQHPNAFGRGYRLIVYDGFGKQKIPYTNYEGKQISAEIPEFIHLVFLPKMLRMTRAKSQARFDISYAASLKLANSAEIGVKSRSRAIARRPYQQPLFG